MYCDGVYFEKNFCKATEKKLRFQKKIYKTVDLFLKDFFKDSNIQ